MIAMKEMKYMPKFKVSIIPGHGGFDPGAANSNTKTRECDGNLSVGLKLKQLLEFNGFDAVISRTADIACGGAKTVSQDITNQINFANKSGADIAIAIHFNSSANKTATGTEVLYTNYPTRDENEIRLAKLLLEELVNTTKLRNRGLKETPSGVGVIKKVKIPCVLSECAFVSNDKESIWCSDEQHNWQLARAHARAICRYFGKEYIDLVKTNVKLNGKKLSNGYLINDSNYVPVRALCEAFGCTLSWDQNSKTVNIIKK